MSGMQSPEAPPRYPDLVADELPMYSRQPSPPPSGARSRQSPREFTYDLTNRKGKTWLRMTVKGDPLLSKHMATIIEGTSLNGRVDLSLDSSETIQAITISALGRIIAGANPGESYNFLELPLVLWSKAMGNPRSSSSESEGRQSGKLLGEYSWPFQITLPKDVTLNIGSQGSAQTYSLPQTFLERHTKASVQYDINLRVSRGKLRADSKLSATFGYLPIIKPGAPSLLRQLAYQENSPLLGPDGDPEGWYTVEPTWIRGTVFGKRSITVQCSLSIAKPLCYTRGTTIPCFLDLRSPDIQALDLLSSPNAIVVRLRRRVKYYDPNVSAGIDLGSSTKDSITDSESAMWWSSTEGAASSDAPRRCLSGEIHLNKNLKPTTAIASFRVEYSVVLFPFDAPAFTPADTDILLTQPVEIGTAYAPGPRPRVYSPPNYETPVRSDPYYRGYPNSGFF